MEYNLPANATVTITLNLSGAFLQLDWVSFTPLQEREQRGDGGRGLGAAGREARVPWFLSYPVPDS